MRTDNEYSKLKNTKDELCLTLILPLHSVPAQAEEDVIRFNKIVSSVITELDQNAFVEDAREIKARLNSLKMEFQKITGAKGIGIYISGNVKMMIPFPFEVQEHYAIGQQFLIRELIYNEELSIDYFVLCLTTKSAKLFKGNSGNLVEMSGSDILKFEDDKEYTHTSIGSSTGYSLKSVEKDRSETQVLGLKKFYKEVDHFISEKIPSGSLLIVTGSGKEPSIFRSLSKHTSMIIGEIHGNFEHDYADLKIRSWHLFESAFNSMQNKIIDEIEEKFGRGLVAAGFEDSYVSALEGKGLTLVLEKNILQNGYLNRKMNLIADTKETAEFESVSDVGSLIAQIVIGKHGKVTFVDSGALDKFEGIALIKRYQ